MDPMSCCNINPHTSAMAKLAHAPSRSRSRSRHCDGSQQMVQMGPGEGEDSYVKNSSVQSHVLRITEGPLWQGIRSASRIPEIGDAGKALRVADLGCATGENTVRAVDKLLASLAALWESKSQLHAFPDCVEVFFADLASNDFNTLFRHLQSGPGCRDSRPIRYFAAGVPGSFFHRLFPTSSIHAVTCFTALHWLSQIPPEVLDPRSPAFNSDRVHVRGADPEVDRAFAAQSSRDMAAFLAHRASELVPGGFLALAMLAKPDEHRGHRAELQDLFHDTFHDLAVQGVIPRCLLQSFNIPMYFPSVAQVRRAVEEVGLFDIHFLQSCGDVANYPAHTCEDYRADLRRFARDSAFLWKSLFRTSMEEHFGVELSNRVFEQYELRVQTRGELERHGRNIDDYFTVNYAVALLTRK